MFATRAIWRGIPTTSMCAWPRIPGREQALQHGNALITESDEMEKCSGEGSLMATFLSNYHLGKSNNISDHARNKKSTIVDQF